MEAGSWKQDIIKYEASIMFVAISYWLLAFGCWPRTSRPRSRKQDIIKYEASIMFVAISYWLLAFGCWLRTSWPTEAGELRAYL